MSANDPVTSAPAAPREVRPGAPAAARAPSDVVARRRSPWSRLGRWLLRVLPSLALVVLFLVIWEVWVEAGDVPSYLLVAPSDVASFIWTDWSSFAGDVRVTVTEAFLGLLLGTILGMSLSIAIVHSPLLSRALMPLIVGSQVVPKVAIAPLFILWFGVGMLPKVVVAMLMAFFPIVINHTFGLRSVPDDMLDLGRSLRASTFKLFYKIRMPYSLPALFSGLKLASTLAIIGAVVGEFIAASSGLGYRVVFANQNLDAKSMLASVVLLVGIGILFFGAITLLERIVAPWAKTSGPAQGGSA
jgi:ABC-type nitrate/sulfonate/bicarbonate transport system permease component